MYKRRDWLHLHGEDGGNSESSADDSSDDEAAVNRMVAAGQGDREAAVSSSDNDSGSGSSSGKSGDDSSVESEPEDTLSASDSDADPSAFQKLEDISEDDFDEGEFNAELEKLKRVWLNPATPAAIPPMAEDTPEDAGASSGSRSDHDGDQKGDGPVKGGKAAPRKALKCRVCDGKLLLNPLMLRQHIASKKHVKRCLGDPEDPICFAESLGPKENVETHQERSQRIAAEKQQQEQAAEAAQAAAALKLQRRVQRKRKRLEASTVAAPAGTAGQLAGSPQEPHQQKLSQKKKGKMGKRQRLASKKDGLAEGSIKQHRNDLKSGTKSKSGQKGVHATKVAPSEDNRAAKRAAKQAAFAASNKPAAAET